MNLGDPFSMFMGVLGQILWHLPVLLVWIVGGVMVAGQMQANPRAAALSLAGLAVELVTTLLSVVSSTVVPATLLQNNTSVSDIGTIMMGIGCVTGLLAAIAWGLVLAGLIIALKGPAAAAS